MVQNQLFKEQDLAGDISDAKGDQGALLVMKKMALNRLKPSRGFNTKHL